MLLVASAVLLGLTLFLRLQPIFQLIPVVLFLLVALILTVIDKSEKDKVAYKKIKK